MTGYTPRGLEMRLTRCPQPGDPRRGPHQRAAQELISIVARLTRPGFDLDGCRDLHLEVPRHHHLYRTHYELIEVGEG